MRFRFHRSSLWAYSFHRFESHWSQIATQIPSQSTLLQLSIYPPFIRIFPYFFCTKAPLPQSREHVFASAGEPFSTAVEFWTQMKRNSILEWFTKMLRKRDTRKARKTEIYVQSVVIYECMEWWCGYLEKWRRWPSLRGLLRGVDVVAASGSACADVAPSFLASLSASSVETSSRNLAIAFRCGTSVTNWRTDVSQGSWELTELEIRQCDFSTLLLRGKLLTVQFATRCSIFDNNNNVRDNRGS